MVKAKILIVEDSESLITFYKGVLANIDVKIDTAKSYAEAISKLKVNDYCFHVIDISLDGSESGLDIIGKCGADPESCLILSSTLSEAIIIDLVEVYGVPRSLIMTKPVEADKLIALVNTRINLKQPVLNDQHCIIKDNVVINSNNSISVEKILIANIYDYICNRKIASCIFVIFSIIFMNFFISYLKINAYNEIYSQIEEYQEYRFRHFNNGQSVSETTFVNFSGFELSELYKKLEIEYPELLKTPNSKLNLINSYIQRNQDYIKRVQIKFYPNNNYLIIVTDSDNNIRQLWISDKKYLDELGVGKKLSLIEIFIRSWATTFR